MQNLSEIFTAIRSLMQEYHIKMLDESLVEDLRAALKLGWQMYQKNGWV